MHLLSFNNTDELRGTFGLPCLRRFARDEVLQFGFASPQSGDEGIEFFLRPAIGTMSSRRTGLYSGKHLNAYSRSRDCTRALVSSKILCVTKPSHLGQLGVC